LTSSDQFQGQRELHAGVVCYAHNACIRGAVVAPLIWRAAPTSAQPAWSSHQATRTPFSGADAATKWNMMSFFASKYATPENRWYALVIIALGLAIVIMDATILNVSVPYMLRDLNTPFSNIQWAISGYALTIATVLITVGRVGDFWGRKKVFLLGMVVFAAGSFIASVASGAFLLIIGRAVVQAVGERQWC
jgi:MFS family permease